MTGFVGWAKAAGAAEMWHNAHYAFAHAVSRTGNVEQRGQNRRRRNQDGNAEAGDFTHPTD
jgi:hypothetical protein